MRDKPVTKIFIAAEAVLYTVFMTLDIMGISPDTASVLKYTSIILCVCMAWFRAWRYRDKESVAIAIALFCTVIADYFLLFPREVISPGLASFCVAHLIYMVIILDFDKKNALRGGVIRLAAAAFFFVGYILAADRGMGLSGAWYDRLTVFLLFLYIVTFTMNVVTCGTACFKEGAHRLLFVGLCLFVLCDINVALYNSFPANYLSALLMWAFYLPSQAMVVLSQSFNDQQNAEHKK